MRTIALVLAFVSLAGCRGAPDHAEVAIARVGLDPIAGCDELARAVRDRAIAEMDRLLDANLETALAGRCYVYEDALPPTAATPGPADAAGGGASVRSDTNNQVAGVDEPDSS